MVIDRTIDLHPRRVEPNVRRIDAPHCTNGVPMNSGSLPKPWEEAPHPALHGAPIDDKAALRKPRDHVGIAEPGAHGVADGSGDHVGGEGMVREGSGGASREAAAAGITAPALATEPRLPIVADRVTPTPDARHDQPFQYRLDCVVYLPTRVQQNRSGRRSCARSGLDQLPSPFALPNL